MDPRDKPEDDKGGCLMNESERYNKARAEFSGGT